MHNESIILNTDSYKASHYLQYPPGTTRISSYIESRGGDFQEVVFFGLQLFLQQYLSHPICAADIEEAETVLTAHGLPFNGEGWRHILEQHRGFLPLEIQAIAEGQRLAPGNALVQVINTDPRCAWLTSYVETALLRAVWYPSTVSTLSWHCKQIIERYLLETADSTQGLAFKLHDFGARGASSKETAALGGLAHLVHFQGTDNLSAIVAAQRYYQADMAGFSIPAAEHSTITAWGKANEAAAYDNMLQQFSGPGKTVAVVSDSYDLWHAIDNLWGNRLRQRVESSGGTLVVRPDSGDPVAVVTETIERLIAKFGATTNDKGYRVLPDFIRVIQGDGISLKTIEAILETMKAKGQSAENIAFGMGGALLQKVNRDTLKFAMKASAIEIAGTWRDVFKAPRTDPGKQSKKGRLAVIRDANGQITTIREDSLGPKTNLLQPVYRNGQLLRTVDFEQIRALAARN